MLQLLPLLLKVPDLINAATGIIKSITGDDVPEDVKGNSTKLQKHIEDLPAEQRQNVIEELVAENIRIQELDTDRFVSMNEGDAEKMRATARPEIARRAMAVIETFSKLILWLGFFTALQWSIDNLMGLVNLATTKDLGWKTPSIWTYFKEAEPIAELIWGPLVASFAACCTVILKYFGVRERDKAQQFEIAAGRPLTSAQATIQAAGGFISNTIKAIKG